MPNLFTKICYLHIAFHVVHANKRIIKYIMTLFLYLQAQKSRM